MSNYIDNTYRTNVFSNPQLFSNKIKASITPNPNSALKLEQIAVAVPFTDDGKTSAITTQVSDPEPIILIRIINVYTNNN